MEADSADLVDLCRGLPALEDLMSTSTLFNHKEQSKYEHPNTYIETGTPSIGSASTILDPDTSAKEP